MDQPLSPELLRKMDAYWRAANYLSVGQIYLYDNPLLKDRCERSTSSRGCLGHWGTTPGLNFIYVHLNRAIKQYDLNAIYITGPGHGAPGIVANTYLEGTYSELYPDVAQDEAGHEAAVHAVLLSRRHPQPHGPRDARLDPRRAANWATRSRTPTARLFDNPDLLVACVVGDGEAETGPLATSWHSNKFLNPVRDGAVLPILHLNGYKIAGPTVLARIPHEELDELFRGYGYRPLFCRRRRARSRCTSRWPPTLDKALAEIRQIQDRRPRQRLHSSGPAGR